MVHHFGWKPDLPDHRDYLYNAPEHIAQALPSKVDLSGQCPAVYDQGSLGSCFPAGTPILLANGTERAIEEIGEGQPVLTHLGNTRKVTRTYERTYSGKMYTIGVKGWQYPLQMTAEHPIAIIPNESRRAKYGEFEEGKIVWKKAEELQPGEFVLLPYGVKERTELSTIDVCTYISQDTWSDGKACRVCEAPKRHAIHRYVQINELFAQLVGLFLAEGSYSKSMDGIPHRLVWTFARHEKLYQQFVVDAIQEIFGVTAYIVESDKRPTITNVKCDNTTLACLFHTFCGEHSYRKEVNPLFFSAPRNVKLALLRGWLMGDGTQNPVRNTRAYKDGPSYAGAQIEGATSSEAMHRGMFRIALSCQMKPSAQVRKQQEHQGIEPRTLNFYGADVFTVFPEHAELLERKTQRASTALYKRTEYGYACRISAITIEEVEEAQVYNLEVEDDHTYIANGLAVHNCTANAIGAAFEFDRIKQGLPDFVPSRLFIYYNERVMEHSVSYDSGAQIRDGIKSVAKLGVCPETEWPYDISKFTIKPPAKCYTDALKDLVVKYARVRRDLQQMKACLASGWPVIFGISVYDSFESDEVNRTGVVPMPGPDESLLGGHALLLTGFNSDDQVFFFRNSWGTEWAAESTVAPGYGTIPEAYIMNHGLASDFWTIRLVQ